MRYPKCLQKMKRVIYSVLFLLTFSISAQSQTLEKLLNIQIRPGFAILNNGDTLLGAFEFNDAKENYRLLVYKDPLTHKNKAYLPQTVQIFSVDSFYFRPVEFENEWVFMRILFEDKVKLYLHKKYYTTFERSGFYNQFYIIRPDGKSLMINTDNFFPFKTRAGTFFKDCETVYKKIINNTYTAKNLLEIFEEYNNWLNSKSM
jgi:hypothetical protein